MNLELAKDLKKRCLSDTVLKDISTRVLLVSSKQLAMILGKKDDGSLRSSRSKKTGFNFHTDTQGNIYYNLIEVFNKLGIKL